MSSTYRTNDTQYIDVVRVLQRSRHMNIDVCYALEGSRDITAVTGLVGSNTTWCFTLKANAGMGRASHYTYILEATPARVNFKPM